MPLGTGRAEQRPGPLVDGAEVMRQQDRHAHLLQHAGVIATRGDRSRNERATPLRIVFPEILRRLVAGDQ